ncbi:hypothetical protein M407DRAFT_246768 [Tulasnella calospora MUT 4182]|uniref:Uncharacterized protein n=1 Tax=Tulasnella calospora MUT 4182 TaxID=1051891 RepID=A0A0C3PRT6_9AGAM|nr:hypothetical protein M407DRAFT_246768 [Tulasnella calospora MUT 4182]
MSEEKGASNNERLLNAAREDHADLLEEILEEDDVDINYKDGLGNTALHYAVQRGSENVIEKILECEGCDVDLQNRVDGATPLHLACQLEDDDARATMIWHLLEAGANMRIKDKHGSIAEDLLPGDDEDNKKLFRDYQATNAIAADDIAEDSDGEPGSGSDED